mgnify:CR=1 FL=1
MTSAFQHKREDNIWFCHDGALRGSRSSVQRVAPSPFDIERSIARIDQGQALEMFDRAMTGEYASLTRAGAP